MPNDTISFGIDGEVTIKTVEDTVVSLRKVLDRLTADVAPWAKVTWVLGELDGGSLRATFRGCPAEGGSDSDVTSIVTRYADVGVAVAAGKELPCTEGVVQAVEDLLSVAQRSGSEATFAADGRTLRVDLRTWKHSHARGASRAIGSVTGVIKGISASGQPHISVYESANARAVRCYVTEEQLQWALSAWGETVYVLGNLTRDRNSRGKREIRQVIKYRVLQDEMGSRFEDAFGVGKWQPGDPTSVAVIRAARDEE